MDPEQKSQTTPEPSSVAYSHPHKSNTRLLLLLILILFILVGWGGYYLGQNAPAKQMYVVPSPAVQVTKPSPIAVASQVDATAGWKTYTSNKAQYSFRHPVNWPLVEVPVAVGCIVCTEDIAISPAYDPNN